MLDDITAPDLLALTAEIVAAHVANNSVTQADLPALIQNVHRTLAGLGEPPATPPEEKRQPAVSIKRSITPDYLVCLDDGKKLKTLKRHLMVSFGLTPELYRERWGLPKDYPMVAPNYSARRSAMAKQIGLGSKPKVKSRSARKGAK
ncbi:MucR family transcriptional regulator [Plastoroseomonas hellenica]|uniref:MucR family transcriptional regulator n=1 Tax=Plastoroseomonas hellenica TaxID=2687306 RepID=UPI001BA78A11|nr:MucR family transcriptional regulator [Plastoroseomonas hellenica]MBR0641284.1 MucR family transcriptional regulator [Plastoroseomonas hellenica]